MMIAMIEEDVLDMVAAHVLAVEPDAVATDRAANAIEIVARGRH